MAKNLVTAVKEKSILQEVAPEYWEQACRELMKQDRILKKLIPKYGSGFLQTRGDAFTTLARAIVGQQISVAAAQSVWTKVLLASKNKVNPKNILALSIEDLRAAADILKGKKISPSLRMLVVPGSARVRLEAEAEGLDKVFLDAGAEWRNAGCSMCLGMNPDQLAVGERSASTSNRNFEGRQGKGGRTHLVSPLVAAATALRGTLSSPADL